MNRPSRAISLACALLAFLQFGWIAYVFGDRWQLCAEAARGVVEGRPHWRIYQSRVLSPYLVEGLSYIFPSYAAALAFFAIVTLAIAGVLAWRIGAPTGRGVISLAVFHALFALLAAPKWLYAWDFVDVIVFLLFVDFVQAKRPWPWFLALAAAGSLNHEIAAYIALYVVFERPAASLATFAGCLGLVELLRRALLVEEMGPTMFPDAPRDIGSSFHFALPHNVELVHRMFSHLERATFAVPIIAALAIASGVRLARRFPALVAVHAVVFASLLVFGAVTETRIYVVLIPLVLLGMS